MDWKHWDAEKPAVGQNVYYKTSTFSGAGEVARLATKGIVLFEPQDPAATPIVPELWAEVPSPHESWIDWTKHEPPAGVYIWMRDYTSPEICELAWTLGLPGKILAVLPGDETMSRHRGDQWQLISKPDF